MEGVVSARSTIAKASEVVGEGAGILGTAAGHEDRDYSISMKSLQ